MTNAQEKAGAHAPRAPIPSKEIAGLIGNTPLVRIGSLTAHVSHNLWAKCEFMNPTGSVKDRAAIAMIRAAEQARQIVPHTSVLVEATAGNTGVGLAAVAGSQYRLKCVLTDKFGPDKVNLLQAWGAEVIICPSNVDHSDPQFWLNTAQSLGNEDHHFYIDQFSNPANPEAHYRTTGPEIWEQTSGKIDAVVAGFGTGGTLMGVARFLKERRPEIRIIIADPIGSILRCPPEELTPKPYLVEGIGSSFFPTLFDPTLVDQVISVSDVESFEMCIKLARQEGLFVGGSAGCAVAAAVKYLSCSSNRPANIVTILPDGGDRYISTIYSPKWRQEKCQMI
ncbi:cysteine synthase family protein [Mesorhizobium sp. M0619]|uniref:PLP-dependent cysteine synthase family protein n=1 Tax=unclassified Mesorhizobium TaxID=325217 RepID=UPI003334CF26